MLSWEAEREVLNNIMISYKKLFSVLLSAFFIMLPVSTFASEAPAEGFARIPWAIKCCGAMPKGMTVGFAVLAVIIALTVIYGIKVNGGRHNGK